MKKILVLALAIVMGVGCMLTMSSCTPKPETDLDDAKANLESNNYLVVIDEDSEEDPLPIGIEAVLTAYDLSDFIEQKQKENESFDFQEYKEALGEKFVETILTLLGSSPDLTIRVYESKKLASFAYDGYVLEREAEEAIEAAEEKDAKKYGPDYYTGKEKEKYSEEMEDLSYERAKYMLKKYESELSKEENANIKKQYESIVEAYEQSNETVFGMKGKVFWVGTEAAIKASK